MEKPLHLTTKELAELLRIKERKVYDLVASGSVPHTKATGKILFPRAEVEAWLASHASGPAPARAKSRNPVMLGSHDPVLEWALRESGCGIAALFDGSRDGLDRFAAGEGVATGLHIPDEAGENWNAGIVSERFRGEPVVLIEWSRRNRGILVAPGNPLGIRSLSDLGSRRIVSRQAGAGSQILFEKLAGNANGGSGMPVKAVTARTESDAALAVLDGKADAAFGLRSVAEQFRLGFVPVIEERFDLLVDRRAYFEKPFQRLLAFCRSEAFRTHVAELPGCDFSGFETVHFNA